MSESVRTTDFRTDSDETNTEYTSRRDASSVGRLLTQLVDDVAVLIRKELALAGSEVSHSIEQAKAGVGGLVGGGAVLYAGMLFLLLAATLGLAEVMPAWAAALIVGGAVSLVGLIMFQGGKSRMQPSAFTPDRTKRAVRDDAEMIRRQTHHE